MLKSDNSGSSKSSGNSTSEKTPALKPNWDFTEVPEYNKTLPEIMKLIQAASNIT